LTVSLSISFGIGVMIVIDLIGYCILPAFIFFGILRLGHWEARSTFYSLANEITNENRRQIKDTEDKLIALILESQKSEQRKVRSNSND
jgi:hypothetical protein